MPLARCIQRCWNSQTCKRYFPGDIEDLPEDHIFITGGKHENKCFEIVTAEQLSQEKTANQMQIKELEGKILTLTKTVEKLSLRR